MINKILKVAGVIILIAIIWWILYSLEILPAGFTPFVGSTYQSVFLTNGQVYFGHLYWQNHQYSVLRDVYYLQVTQPPQPIVAGQTPPTNINIVKLGGELHGPTDEMRINRDTVLFIEDLKPDSKVVSAINQLKAPATK
jgi:hypothetical protein